MQMSFIMLVSQYGQFKEAVYGSPNLHPLLDQIKNGTETSPFLPEFECDFKRFKEGIRERKLCLNHHQTVDLYARAPQVGTGLFTCPSTNFKGQILILKLHEIH